MYYTNVSYVPTRTLISILRTYKFLLQFIAWSFRFNEAYLPTYVHTIQPSHTPVNKFILTENLDVAKTIKVNSDIINLVRITY